MIKLLRRAGARLWASGLIGLAVLWCALGRVAYYWCSRVLVSPWRHRINDIHHLDLGTLRLLLISFTQNAVFPLLVILFLVRLILNPFVDAFVYCRLGRCSRVLWQAFGKLYIVFYLTIGLVGWLLYLEADWLLTRPLLFVVGALGFSLWFALYRARLVSDRRAWPTPTAGLQLVLAWLLLVSTATTVSLWLYKKAISLKGWPLALLFFVGELLLIWIKLWRTSCVVETVDQEAHEVD